ncbi:MAG TPA: DUF2252 family protein, partial [Verrucomicrobiae bacterium]|nr:DUF2252 family protein [Verrucomicrobiae bacterium]
MNIIEATKSYEAWVSKLTPLLKEDLRLKHAEMRRDLFSFLRATYYRWAQVWPKACKEFAVAPTVLAVGDLHVENFGTWRDIDGRLVWGVNDFDECHPLPFTNDLIRLTVSVRLAIEGGELAATPKLASVTILEGYKDCLAAGGNPLVLVDKSTPLRVMARHRLDAPEKFWKKLLSHPPIKKPVPAEVLRVIRELLPHKGVPLKFLHRIAGLGSLGKERFTAVGTWLGGQIAREAKALTPSACLWALGHKPGGVIRYEQILRIAVRCPDPLVKVRGAWLIRRLSPDCFRIPLSSLPKKLDETRLLYAMGWETANIHLGSAGAAQIKKHLQQMPA